MHEVRILIGCKVALPLSRSLDMCVLALPSRNGLNLSEFQSLQTTRLTSLVGHLSMILESNVVHFVTGKVALWNMFLDRPLSEYFRNSIFTHLRVTLFLSILEMKKLASLHETNSRRYNYVTKDEQHPKAVLNYFYERSVY
jgi:hypothetical protein